MMTHEKKLQELIIDIREKLPRLMELEVGCLVKIKCKHTSSVKLAYVLTINKKGEEIESIYICYPDEYCFRLDDFSRISEIIGKEPMLNDVLEWFILNPKGRDFSPTGMGNLILRNYNKGTVDIQEWELSKPYLRDQSEELMDFLYKLIKQ